MEATRYFPKWDNVDYIVASPYARGTAGYQGVPEQDVYDVLADVKKRFKIDEDRTYLTGLSMGRWYVVDRAYAPGHLGSYCTRMPRTARRNVRPGA